MFDREKALERFRAALVATGKTSGEQADELCAHVTDAMGEIDSAALTEEERFLVATHRIGRPTELADEYEKATPWRTWRTPIHWAAAGVAWTLGVESVLENAIPAGALAVTRFGLPPNWMQIWSVIVLVGGPLIAFASVGAWMRRFSASHPASIKALYATTAIAAGIRLVSAPVSSALNATAWRGYDRAAWHAFVQTSHIAEMVGLAMTVCVAALAISRFRAIK